MDVILATQNESKALQIQTLLAGSSVRVQTMGDIDIPEDVEDGDTEEENAFKKAWYVHERRPGSWVMSDDTGLYIAALNGQPGIRAKRWLGDISTEEITKGTLQLLEGVTDRTAIFRTAAVVISPEGEKYVFMGEISGRLLEAAACEPQPQMPYSPLFVPDGEELCWALMATEHENAISHRGIAFRKVQAFFEQLA